MHIVKDSNNTTGTRPNVVEFKADPEFQGFRKIPRLNRDIIITEKIDGTNASVLITEEGEIYAGKRTSWCTPEKDNHGFAKWVQENKTELLKLGPGRHFGEWWGMGIQRKYGLKEHRFSLFNTSRDRSNDPNCISYVPVLYSGFFSTYAVESCVGRLRKEGSMAVPGWMQPEGVVVFHTAAGQYFKVTLEHDEKPKGVVDIPTK